MVAKAYIKLYQEVLRDHEEPGRLLRAGREKDGLAANPLGDPLYDETDIEAARECIAQALDAADGGYAPKTEEEAALLQVARHFAMVSLSQKAKIDRFRAERNSPSRLLKRFARLMMKKGDFEKV